MVIADEKNICCHDDKLCGYIHDKINIPNTQYHQYFNLKKKHNLYIKGKKDMFAALITIKCFVNNEDYINFIDSIVALINNFLVKVNCIDKEKFLEYLHLPIDFEKIKDL